MYVLLILLAFVLVLLLRAAAFKPAAEEKVELSPEEKPMYSTSFPALR